MKRIIFLPINPLIYLLVLIASSNINARTWTNLAGKKIEADLIEATTEPVRIRKIESEKIYELPISSFCIEDQKFITETAKTIEPIQPDHSVSLETIDKKSAKAKNAWQLILEDYKKAKLIYAYSSDQVKQKVETVRKTAKWADYKMKEAKKNLEHAIDSIPSDPKLDKKDQVVEKETTETLALTANYPRFDNQ